MSIISALIGVDLGRRLKKLGEKWGGGVSTRESRQAAGSLRSCGLAERGSEPAACRLSKA